MPLSLAHWAAVALFICPYDARAFVALPRPLSPMLKTTTSFNSHSVGHGHCHRRAPLRLEAGGGGGVGGGVGGGEGEGDGEKKPPRSVLQRPWDVEVDLYGERHIITVQPGDSILEAVSCIYDPAATVNARYVLLFVDVRTEFLMST